MATLSFGKHLVPVQWRPRVAQFYHRARLGLATRKTQLTSFLIEHFLLSSAIGRLTYFRVFSTAFNREEHAVAAGRLAYAKALRSRRHSSYLLRRNIHRIEKGLIADGPSRVFARDYIVETVEELTSLSEEIPPSAEQRWAIDVLTEYFGAVPGSDPVVAKAHQAFLKYTEAPKAGESRPYVRNLDDSPVSIAALQNLAIRRRSVRHYLPDPVDRALVDKAIDVARQSPSACNRQAISFRIFDTPDAAQAVAQLPMGTKSFLHNIQNTVVVIGHLRAYPFARDRHAIYIDGALAAMSFAYGLEAQGLASCMINWADLPEPDRKLAKLLNLAPDDRAIMLMSYGYPDPNARVPYSAKRPLSQFRSFHTEI